MYVTTQQSQPKTRGRAVHLLSCARMFYSAEAAVQLARRYGIDTEPLLTPVSHVFILRPKKEFKKLWLDKRQGHFFMRGECESPKCDKLYQSNGALGTHATEGKRETETQPG